MQQISIVPAEKSKPNGEVFLNLTFDNF